jgi:hypothetical protein
MRAILSFRRFLVAASTLLLFASSPALHASGTENGFAPWVRYRFYSDATLTTQVGQTDVNAGCIQGETYSTGTQTAYYTAQLIHYCS